MFAYPYWKKTKEIWTSRETSGITSELEFCSHYLSKYFNLYILLASKIPNKGMCNPKDKSNNTTHQNGYQTISVGQRKYMALDTLVLVMKMAFCYCVSFTGTSPAAPAPRKKNSRLLSFSPSSTEPDVTHIQLQSGILSLSSYGI